MRDRFAVIIPVFNHAGTAAAVISAAKGLGFPVIVVDDGSTDGLAELLASVPDIQVVRHPQNRGKGAALQSGFEAARTVADWAITLDADGQHDPSDAKRFLQAIAKTPPPEPAISGALLAPSDRNAVKARALFIGRREGMLDDASVPWTSRFGRGFSNFWVRSAGGPRVSDTQSGFRMYPLPEALSWGVRSRRFQFEVEILVRAHWHGVPVLEIPVSVNYQPPLGRISHFRPFVDFCRNGATFMRLIATRLLVEPFRRRTRPSLPAPIR